MSNTDSQENNHFSFNFGNEDPIFHFEESPSHKVVPKLVNDLQQIVNDLLAKSDDLKKLTTSLSTNSPFGIPEFLKSGIVDTCMITPIQEKVKLSGLHVGAVDGGLVTSSLAGMEILGLKAVGVYLHYGTHNITKTKYVPNKHHDITLLPVYTNFTATDFDLYSSLQRSILELKAGIQLLDEAPASLDYLLMDGSFQFKRISTQNTEINVLFGKYFAFLRKLYSKAQIHNTTLLFIVKDSKKSTFISILSQLLPHVISSFPELYSIDYRTMIQNLRDATFMHYLLQPRTRSLIINRSFSTEDVEITNIPYSFYLKVVKNDIPLRVDMLLRPNMTPGEITKIANECSSVLLAMSDFNTSYSLPAPIIEADARAKINVEEFEMILEYIRSRTFNYHTIEGIKLRRSRSPFKFS